MIQFTKMHGAGNDYVYVDCFAQPVPENLPELARRIADRHFGVGGDGLILIRPSEIADGRMQMFNADGSQAEMCGNGIRCVAKYLFEHDLVRKESLAIETDAGVLDLELQLVDGQVEKIRVNMGEPILDAERIPTTLSESPIVDTPLTIGGATYLATCLSMGNPHCVIFVDEPTDDLVLVEGSKIEVSDYFPEKTNVEFAQVLSASEIKQRTWERGSGETLACGTGASAVCVAGVLSNRTARRVTIHLPGGDLELEWNETDNHVYMTGPAEEVFSGEWDETLR